MMAPIKGNRFLAGNFVNFSFRWRRVPGKNRGELKWQWHGHPDEEVSRIKGHAHCRRFRRNIDYLTVGIRYEIWSTDCVYRFSWKKAMASMVRRRVKKGPSRKCKTSTAAEPDEKTSTSSENRLTRMIYLFVESTQMQHPVTSACFLRFQFRRIRPNWPDNRSNVRDWDIPWGWDLLNPTNTRPTWLDGKPKCISRFSLLIVAIVSQPGFSFFWISELINFVVHWLGHGNPL